MATTDQDASKNRHGNDALGSGGQTHTADSAAPQLLNRECVAVGDGARSNGAKIRQSKDARGVLEVLYMKRTRAVVGAGFQVREMLFGDEFTSLRIFNWALRDVAKLRDWIESSTEGLEFAATYGRVIDYIAIDAEDAVTLHLASKHIALRLYTGLSAFEGWTVQPARATLATSPEALTRTMITGRITVTWASSVAIGRARLYFADASAANAFITSWKNKQSDLQHCSVSLVGIPTHDDDDRRDLGEEATVARVMRRSRYDDRPWYPPLRRAYLVPTDRLVYTIFFDEEKISEMASAESAQLEFCVVLTSGVALDVDERQLQELVHPHTMIHCVIERADTLNRPPPDPVDCQRRMDPLHWYLTPTEKHIPWVNKHTKREGMSVDFQSVERLERVYRSAAHPWFWSEMDTPHGQPVRLGIEYIVERSLETAVFVLFRTAYDRIRHRLVYKGVWCSVAKRVDDDAQYMDLQISSSSRDMLDHATAVIDKAIGCAKVEFEAQRKTIPKAPTDGAGHRDCGVCMMPADDPFVEFDECGHTFCLECIEPGVSSSSRLPIKCPVEGCGRNVHVEDIFNITKDVRALLETAAFDYVARYPNETVVCPKSGCNQILPRATTAADPFVACESCARSYCLVCSEATGYPTERHDGMNCEGYQASGKSGDHHVRFVRDRIFTLCCPHCKSAFFDFDGCTAVRCGNATCNHYFCANCLEFSSPKSAATHTHVLSCAKNPKRGTFHSSTAALKATHRTRRTDQLRDYIFTKIESSATRRIVLERLAKDVADLGIVLPTDIYERAGMDPRVMARATTQQLTENDTSPIRPLFFDFGRGQLRAPAPPHDRFNPFAPVRPALFEFGRDHAARALPEERFNPFVPMPQAEIERRAAARRIAAFAYAYPRPPAPAPAPRQLPLPGAGFVFPPRAPLPATPNGFFFLPRVDEIPPAATPAAAARAREERLNEELRMQLDAYAQSRLRDPYEFL